MKKLFTILFLFSMYWGQAQQLDYRQGELLIQFQPDIALDKWLQKWSHFEGRPTAIALDKKVAPIGDIWLSSFDFTQIHETRFLDAIRRDPMVQIAQFNHFITTRSTTPDDTQFPNQWQYINTGQSGGQEGADIDIDLAWDITTGGFTSQGDTIVVAVLDDGIDLNHDDFEDNLWVNTAEIPNNGLDDDNNGYIDDYRGWNSNEDNDNIAGGGHGTPVAGIVGAKGNNANGVSGISWNVKVMVVKNNFNTTEAGVLAAYSYPLAMRQRMKAMGKKAPLSYLPTRHGA